MQTEPVWPAIPKFASKTRILDQIALLFLFMAGKLQFRESRSQG
jgi:hypothetical protein